MADHASSPDSRPWGASAYWETRFLGEDTPWELGKPSSVVLEALTAAEAAGLALSGARTLSPGCGSGKDAIALAERGAEVVALDWSPFAISALSTRIEALEPAVRARMSLLSGDFFAVAPSGLDLVVEHTFFCALDPSRRCDYAHTMARIVRPGGFLAGNFFIVSEEELPSLPNRSLTREGAGPPFASTAGELRALLNDFQLLELRPALHPDEERRPGIEWVGIFQRCA